MTTHKNCPQCGAAVYVVTAAAGGCIEETVIVARGLRLERRSRPATYEACRACEWCEEVSR